MRKRGSSLILVVVIMSAIITVVFGANRLALVQYNQSNRDEDNVAALYAAKAGIEDGLARFRYNRDAETGATPDRYDLTTGTQNANPIPTDQYYDLSIKFRNSQIGSFTDFTNNPTAVKDTVLELTGFSQDWPNPYYLRYRFDFFDCSPNQSQLVQIQQITQTADQNAPITYDQITVKKPNGTTVDSQDTTNIFIHSLPNAGERLTSSVRLRAYGCSIKYALATTESSGAGGNVGPEFDNLKTTITATGYYGQTKRTLVADINRVSGQLIGIYDFNIYAGGGSPNTGDIKP